MPFDPDGVLGTNSCGWFKYSSQLQAAADRQRRYSKRRSHKARSARTRQLMWTGSGPITIDPNGSINYFIKINVRPSMPEPGGMLRASVGLAIAAGQRGGWDGKSCLVNGRIRRRLRLAVLTPDSAFSTLVVKS
jgi:hypothetical protein